ncbi:TPA: hypothetical protein MO340_004286 [Salmonella enterica subsp. salamae serovar 35:g,m,s,t:-]|nr:hypothetical protein [Salmonella enterica subsp. salamae serovar 35:g,m,s,t:-]HCA3549756.1 hypothetical protein [Salmonella enterica subsp. salamae serovar 35:g,m,s,t:-]
MERKLTNQDIEHLSRLYERLEAAAEELDYCKKIFSSSPEHVEQLQLDESAIYAICDRIELWATGTPPIKRY